MTILDTFVSVFTADTNDLKKGYDQANRGADDVVESMKDAEVQAKKTGDELASMAKKAAGFLIAAALANKGVQDIVAQAAEISRMDDTSESINTAIEDVDAFGKSIMSLGGDKQAAEESLVSMFKSVADAATDSGSAAAKAFNEIGVSARNAEGGARPVIDVLKDVAGAVEGMDVAKAKEYLATIGVTDRSTVEAILKGRDTLEGMMRSQKEMGVVTKETAERAKAFEAAMGGLTAGLDRSKQMITGAVLPAFTLVVEWLKSLVDWANENKDVVVGFFIAVATVVAATYLPAMVSAAAATLAALWPLLLIGAAVAALAAAFALVYDDIMNFVRGNDSFIGQVIEKYPALGKIIMAIFDAWKTLFGYLGDALAYITELTGTSFDSMGGFIKTFINFLLSSLNTVAEWGLEFIGYFRGAADTVAGIFEWLVEKIRAALSFMMSGIDSVKSGVKAVGGWFGFGGDEEEAKPEPVVSRSLQTKPNINDPSTVPDITAPKARTVGGSTQSVITGSLPSDPAPTPQAAPKQPSATQQAEQASKLNNDAVAFTQQVEKARESMSSASSHLSAAQSDPMNSVTSNAISNSTSVTNETNVQVGEITIETQATDAQGVAGSVGSELQDQLKNLQAQTATGMAR